MSRSVLSRGFFAAAETVDKRFSWHRLPRPLGVLTLMGLRDQLRAENLYATESRNGGAEPPPWSPRYLTARTLDGTYNDLRSARMGSAGTRFGRNFPPEHTYPEQMPRLLEPNPRTVSRELLTREEFLPASTLNVLAAAWIQFEVHDWVFHGVPGADDPWQVQCSDDDEWPEKPMLIRRTCPDPSPDANGGPATWVNTETHWWDGSQIYGGSEEEAARLRAGELGRLRMDERGLVPRELDELLDYAGVPGTMWVGLSVLHSLFMREHNAICDRLRAEHPQWDDEQLFQTAARRNPHGRLTTPQDVGRAIVVLSHPDTYWITGNVIGVDGGEDIVG